MLLAVLFSCFAFLANAQTLFLPNATSGIGASVNGNIGIGISNPLYPFQISDNGPWPWSGIAMFPGNGTAQNARLFACKDNGLLLHASSQWAYYGQSGIFLGSGLNTTKQKITYLSQSFDFKILGFTTLLDGPDHGTKIVTIDDTYNSTTYAPEGPHLRVLGGIKAKKITVTQNVWADYVFADDFKLRSLAEVATFIGKNKHLPDVPSQAEITANGLDLGEMQKIHMQKIEELTLYLLEQEKRIQLLEQKLLQLSEKK